MATTNAVNTSLSGQTGTGNFVGSTSATLITPVLGVSSATSVNFGGSSTNGIIGVTSAVNAASGVVGESVSSIIPNGSAVSFSTGVTKDLTSISLTAGDWDLFGNIVFIGTTITQSIVWISATTASLPDSSLFNTIAGLSTSSSLGINAPYFRASLGSTTTIYLSGAATGTGSITGRGGIYARRTR